MAKKNQPSGPPRERSTLLTIAIILVILHSLLWTAVSIATRRANPEGAQLLLALVAITSILGVVAGIGMWFWKKWAIYLYAVMGVAGSLLVLVLSGNLFLAFGSLIPIIVVLYILRPNMHFFT